MPFLKRNGFSIYYRIRGRGIPIIFLHGMGLSHQIWLKTIYQMAKDFCFILFDLRGHGESGEPDEEYGMDEYVDDLDNLINYFELDQVILVGHSLGGMISMAYYLVHPEKVAGLLLVATLAKPPVSEKLVNAVERGVNIFAKSLRYLSKLPEKVVPSSFFQIINTHPHALLMAGNVAYNIDLENELKKIKIPTHIIAGRRDFITPVRAAKKLHQGVKNSTLTIFPLAGHLVMADSPQKFQKWLQHHLDEVVTLMSKSKRKIAAKPLISKLKNDKR